MLADAEIDDIQASAEGTIYLEWFESFNDSAVDPDSEQNNSTMPVTLPGGLRLECTDQAACDAAVGGSGGEQVSLPVTFDDENVNYDLFGFGGAVPEIVEDPEDASNNALQILRTGGAEFFAGISVGQESGLTEPIPFAEGSTTMNMRVWSPEAGVPIRFKVEAFDDPTISVETEVLTTVAMGWETINFDFSNEVPMTAPINFASSYTKLTIFPNFQTPEDPPLPEQTYFVDDIAFGAADTPGADVALNEFRVDQGGADNDEYVEIAGEAGTSLDGLTLLVIGDGDGGQGVIENVTSLNGQTIPASGLFVAAEETFTLGTADFTTNLNFENGQSSTFVLVSGFSGSDGDDLDTDDDGTPDVAPWDEIVDAIGISSGDAEDIAYGAALGFEDIGPNGSFPPAQFYRASDSGAWIIGQFDLGVTDTPGAMNPAAPIANVQVIHNSPDPIAGVVDIYLNGGDTPAIDDLAFRAATPFVALPAGVNLEIGVAPGSSTGPGDIIASFPAVLPEGDFVVIAEGVVEPALFEPNPSEEDISFTINVVPVDVDLALGASVDLLIHHGITDAPAVDVVVVDGEVVLADGIVFGDAVYLPGIPAADDVVIEVRADADDSVVFTVEADLLQFDGELLSVLASGFLTPDNEPPGAAAAAIVAIPQAGGSGIILPAPSEPGALTFDPSPLVEMLNSGETGTETVSLINNTDGEVTFDFTQYSGDNLDKAPPTSGQPSLELAKGENDPRGYAQRFDAGGPDAFGYSWIDSNEPGGPAFETIDISETGTELVEADFDPEGCGFGALDEGNALVDLPFDFSFYGESYSSVKVNINGNLNFNADGAPLPCAFTNDPLPDAGDPNGGILAVLWDDFDATGGGGQIFFETLPDGRFIVQYDNLERFGGANDGITNTFQVILSPSGAIKYQYVDFNDTAPSYSIGIENPDGTIGLEVAMGADYVVNGLAVLIQAAPPFVTGVSPATGTIPAGGSVDVGVDFSAEGLNGGTFEGTLDVATNLADPSNFELPVVLEVMGTADCVLTLDPESFEDTILGNTSEVTATVSNGGTDTCSLTSAATAAPFAVSGFTATEVPPGESYSFTVVYTPTEVGEDSGTLTVGVADDDALTADLSGTALGQPTPELSEESLAFTVIAGETTSGTFDISNVGGADAADLEYSISVVAAANREAGTLARIAQASASKDAQALGRLAKAANEVRGRKAAGLTSGSRGSEVSIGRAPVRDVAGTPVEVERGGEASTAYGHDAAANAFITFDFLTPGTLTPISTIAPAGFFGAGALGEGEDVAYQVDGSLLYSVDTETGTPTLIGDLGIADGLSGMTYDPTTGTYYGSSTNITTSAFYTIDVEAGTATLVGDIGTPGAIALAAAPDGKLYTFDIVDDVLLQVDKTSGAGTVIGSIGFDANFGQGMTYDYVNDVMTMAAFNFTSFQAELRAVDLTTGNSTLIGALGTPGVSQLGWAGAPAGAGFSLVQVDPTSGVIAPENSETITVTVDATDVEPGTYEADLVIATNDPANPTVTLPVTVVVDPFVSNEEAGVPTEFALGQNYPNPFASRTTIDYALPEAARVTVTVYDAVGRRVAVLVNEDATAGYHSAEWDTRGLASGVYLYRIQAGDYTETRKMSIVR